MIALPMVIPRPEWMIQLPYLEGILVIMDGSETYGLITRDLVNE